MSIVQIKAARSVRRGVGRRLRSAVAPGAERGMTTAEYAVGTVAACGMAGVLWKLTQSDTVFNFFTDLVQKALGLFG